MPLHRGQTTAHLRKLRANPEMLAFLCGFDTPGGTWSQTKAHEALAKGGNEQAPRVARAASNRATRPSAALTSRSRCHIPSEPAQIESDSTPQAAVNTCGKRPVSDSRQSRTLPSQLSDSSVPQRPPRLTASKTFRIASEGRISNMLPFRPSFKSFKNSGCGDCLFESFKQILNLTDRVLEMREAVVTRLTKASDQQRVAQLNEHIMREIEFRNTKYMGYGFSGGDGLDDTNARNTLISSRFSELWDKYSVDMQTRHAFAGGAELVALADIYAVNVTVWAYHGATETARHITTHLQSPPANRTVHLLNLGNVHYEATNLPIHEYPVIQAPDHSHLRRSSRKSQPVDLTVHVQTTPDTSTSVVESSPASAPDSDLHQSPESQPAPILRPPIEDYCGLVLNSQSYFESILNGTKIYEVRNISRQLQPRVVFHPSKNVRDQGYTQNIEAEISPFKHDLEIRTAQALLAVTNNGTDLGLTEEETLLLVADYKKKNKTSRFYLYQLSNPKTSEIEWIDSPVCNQMVFSPHQYREKSSKKVVDLFRWPEP